MSKSISFTFLPSQRVFPDTDTILLACRKTYTWGQKCWHQISAASYVEFFNALSAHSLPYVDHQWRLKCFCSLQNNFKKFSEKYLKKVNLKVTFITKRAFLFRYWYLENWSFKLQAQCYYLTTEMNFASKSWRRRGEIRNNQNFLCFFLGGVKFSFVKQNPPHNFLWNEGVKPTAWIISF